MAVVCVFNGKPLLITCDSRMGHITVAICICMIQDTTGATTGHRLKRLRLSMTETVNDCERIHLSKRLPHWWSARYCLNVECHITFFDKKKWRLQYPYKVPFLGFHQTYIYYEILALGANLKTASKAHCISSKSWGHSLKAYHRVNLYSTVSCVCTVCTHNIWCMYHTVYTVYRWNYNMIMCGVLWLFDLLVLSKRVWYHMIYDRVCMHT